MNGTIQNSGFRWSLKKSGMRFGTTLREDASKSKKDQTNKGGITHQKGPLIVNNPMTFGLIIEMNNKMKYGMKCGK